ncbi:Pantothenate kinase [Serratia symbiotica]|nr:Pantothenate kinase [Serratia symbiotica]
MINIKSFLEKKYMKFTYTQWNILKNLIPLNLSEKEIINLKKINKNLSLNEIKKIYIPLSQLLHFFINSNQYNKKKNKEILYKKKYKIPYIIGITGSVSIGKSTTARLLQILLSHWKEHKSVEIITTDNFLYSNKILHKNGIMKLKGFPQSYNIYEMIKCISNIKSGIKYIKTPIYSHLNYDILSNCNKIIKQPDIIILEGLHILQNQINYLYDKNHVYISDFIDFSIYIDAPEKFIKNWYINRFLKFRHKAIYNPDSYFYHYSTLPIFKTVNIAKKIWNTINKLNLQQNILPTRKKAHLIITKNYFHKIESIYLMK